MKSDYFANKNHEGKFISEIFIVDNKDKLKSLEENIDK
jgi:hypothetical protein